MGGPISTGVIAAAAKKGRELSAPSTMTRAATATRVAPAANAYQFGRIQATNGATRTKETRNEWAEGSKAPSVLARTPGRPEACERPMSQGRT